MKLLPRLLTASLCLTSALAAEFPVAKLAHGEITRWVTLPGEVKPFQQATLYAKVGGYVQKVNADIGDEVKEGTVLAELEVPELLADRAKAKAELDLAQLEYDRASDAAKRAPDLVVKQTVDAAKGKLEVAKASSDRIETMLGFAKIIAPFDGVITKRWVDKGAFVPAATSGSAAQQAGVFMIMDITKVRVQIAAPEYESSLVAKAQPVRFSVEGLTGKTFEGSITRFPQTLDAASKTMLVEAEIANAKRELRPNMYVTAKLGLETHKDAPIIPVEGLVMEKATAVTFLFKDGKAKRTVLKIGFNDTKNVEVLEGITPDDQVLLVGTSTVTDGQAVTIKEATK
jgi:RND family efflux transporter MFP subunit